MKNELQNHLEQMELYYWAVLGIATAVSALFIVVMDKAQDMLIMIPL